MGYFKHSVGARAAEDCYGLMLCNGQLRVMMVLFGIGVQLQQRAAIPIEDLFDSARRHGTSDQQKDIMGIQQAQARLKDILLPQNPNKRVVMLQI